MADVASKMSSPDAEREETVVRSPPEPQMTKLTIIKNLVIISLSFLLTFTAFIGTRNLQTSLYPKDKLGNTSLAITNFSSIVSSLLISTVIIYKCGIKWGLFVTLLTRIPLPLSNFFPEWYSLYLGAAIAGLGSGPLWTVKSAYLSHLAAKYAQLSGKPMEVVFSSFFGIFYTAYCCSLFTGNIISSIIIQRPPSNQGQYDENMAIIPSLCGVHYCYEDLDVAFRHVNSTTGSSEESIYHPTTSQVNLLFAIFTLCTVVTVAMAAFVDPIRNSDESMRMKIIEALLETIAHMRKPKEILIIPLSILNGVTIGFIMADFSVGFITCSIGIDYVGYVMAVFGVISALSCGLMALLLKYFGRKMIFVLGGFCNAVSLVLMHSWHPGSHSIPILCFISGLWGFSYAVWNAHLTSFIAYVFRDGSREVAFASNYFWLSMSLAIWHVTSSYMCLYVQIYVLAGFLTVAMASYAAIELMLRAEEAQQQNKNDQPDKTDSIDAMPNKATSLSED